MERPSTDGAQHTIKFEQYEEQLQVFERRKDPLAFSPDILVVQEEKRKHRTKHLTIPVSTTLKAKHRQHPHYRMKC